ncbi:MAG: amidase [Rhizobiales bacterium]|nr:amidase [Hyphomicrobiales bacterium]
MARPTLNFLMGELAAGRTSARALVEASLAAIADPAGEGPRAFIIVDAEGARAAADHIDRLRQHGRQPSPFAGIPFAVKDLFDLAGEVTTVGSVILKGAAAAKADAIAIARLKAQGFIVLGRTNMTEFAYSGVGLNPHYGTPRSAFDRVTGRIPGGSSSGSAVAVADGMCALGIGSDTGGSCRIPAAYNGIVGFKPTTSRVPTTGAFPLSASFDSVGPMANSVACCAIADAIMAGEPVVPLATREPGSLRLAVLRDYVLDGLEDAVAKAFEAALSRLSAAGANLTDLAFIELRDLPSINAKGGIVAAEAWHVHRARIAAEGSAYDRLVRMRIEMAEAISAADYLDYFVRRAAMTGRFDALFQGFDAVIMPTVLNLPPAIAALAEDRDYLRYNAMSLRNTYVGNFLDGCAISLPMTGPGAAPAGFMLMAPGGHDRALMAAASAVETVLAPQQP